MEEGKKIESLSVRIPRDIKVKFKTRVFERGQKLSSVILSFITQYLKETDQEDVNNQ